MKKLTTEQLKIDLPILYETILTQLGTEGLASLDKWMRNINGQSESDMRQLFRDNSDCYADTRTTKNGEVIQALTEDKFIEIIKKEIL